jgi:Mg2+ and Co2+ transporter CorA
MMNDDMPGSGWMSGYGGYWVPILVLAVVVVLVVWVVKQQKK